MNRDNQRMKQRPAYTIGNSRRSNTAMSANTPGPQTYKIIEANKEHSPEYRFGTSLKFRCSTENSPGPGEYKEAHFVGREGAKTTMHGKIKEMA
jgi:hypothetical protein